MTAHANLVKGKTKKSTALKHKKTKKSTAMHDVDVTSMVLAGNKIRAQVAKAITDASISLTVEAASSLNVTIHDQPRKLLDSNILSQRLDVEVDDWVFETAGIGKDGDDFPLVFEDKGVALLRRNKSFKKAVRGKVTRAEFAKSLVDEVPGLTFFCPELHKVQPIAKSTDNTSLDSKDAQLRPGLIGTRKLITVKSKAATDVQLELLQRVLETGQSMRASKKVLVCAIMTITQESDVTNSLGTNGVDVGLFDQNAHMGWPASRDVEKDSAAFFKQAISVDKTDPNISYADLCQAVQRSGAGASFYAQWKTEATRTVNVFLTGRLSAPAAGSVSVVEPYEYTRGDPETRKPEDSWTCLQRLASEVQWYCFAVNMVIYFVSGDYLRAARAVMALSEDSPGVDTINWTVDTGIKISRATITCQAKRWVAKPGQMVQLFDCGRIANGKWVVATISRSLFDTNATIEVQRPVDPLPEPAPTTTQVPGPNSGTGTGPLKLLPGGFAKINADGTASAPASAPEAVKRAIAAGNRLIDKPYIWGGGHGGFNDRGYDCSGAVSYLLNAIDPLGFHTPEDSTELESYGDPGIGDWITVNANSGHAWIEVAGICLNTVHDGTTRGPGGSGPRWRTTRQDSSSFGPFTTRHPVGL